MSNEPLILAIETALRESSVSLLLGSRELSHWVGEPQISSSEVLLAAISSLLKQNQLSIKDVELIAVSKGPGSFTGIRVGLATTAALALGAGKKCGGISLLETLASMSETLNQDVKILTAIAAGNNQIYWQLFSNCGAELKAECEPDLDSCTDFVVMAKAYARAEPKVEIIADRKAIEDLQKNLEGTPKNSDILKVIKIASDNAAKFVGLRMVSLLVGNSNALPNDSKIFDLSPYYLREVRIGK